MIDYPIELCWHGDYTPDLEEVVRKDIIKELFVGGLKEAASLVFHQVFLGPIAERPPSVLVWGEQNDHRFHCEFQKAGTKPAMEFNIDDIPGLREKLEAAGFPKQDED